MKKLQKKYLEVFYKVVRDYETSKMAEARARDGFLKVLGEPLDQFNNDRIEIYKKFCIKDEEGKPDLKDNMYKFDVSVQDETNNELKILGDEEVELNKIPENIKNIIEESKYLTKAGETVIIDEIIALL